MPSVELSKLQGVGPTRALSESDAARTPTRAAAAAGASVAAKPGVTVEVSAATASDFSRPPVDTGRVEEIRAALRNGTYPLLPTEIADAMIAAQVSFALPDVAAE